MRKFFEKFHRGIFGVFLISTLFIIGRTNTVLAVEETYDVRIEAKGEDKSLGIFNEKEDGFWYPGRTLPKEFVVKNNSSKEIQFNKFTVTVQSLSNSLLNKLFNSDEELYKQFSKYLKVTLKDGNSVFYNGSFDDLNSEGVELNTPIKVSPSSQKDFTLTLTFDENAGNDFQNLTHKFNVAIQYTLSDESTGVDTQIPPTDNNTGGGQTGNQTGGQDGSNTGGNQTGGNTGGNQTDNNSNEGQSGSNSGGVDTQIPPTDNNTGGGQTGNNTGGNQTGGQTESQTGSSGNTQTGNNSGSGQTGTNTNVNQPENNSGSVQSGSSVNLPQTGRIFDFTALLFLGMMLAAAGFFLLDFKSRVLSKIFKTKGVK